MRIGPEDNEGNDSYLSFSEDISDISLIAGTKKPKESSNAVTSLLAPLPNKTPIYNDTFIDLTSAGLTSLPIEMVEKYPAIRVRCTYSFLKFFLVGEAVKEQVKR